MNVSDMKIEVEIRQKWYALPVCVISVLLVRCGLNSDKATEFVARHCFSLEVK